ncbi:PTS sugar transporter subunit IIB [Escherichia coli]
MKKILLVCAAGMSTSMLVKRMIDHANAISLEVNISALAIAEAKGKIKNNEVDVVLLGPQRTVKRQMRSLPMMATWVSSITMPGLVTVPMKISCSSAIFT